MKKYTVCLYEGTVDSIEEPLATYLTEAESIDKVNYMPLCFDSFGTNPKYPEFTKWLDRETKRIFTCYYCRSLLFSDRLITVDYGDYSTFIAILEGDHVTDFTEFFANEMREVNKNNG